MQTIDTPRRLIVGITGASGSIYGVRLLEMLQGSGIETHLVMSRWGARTLVHETSLHAGAGQRARHGRASADRPGRHAFRAARS